MEAWGWTETASGNMGILLQQDMERINTLGGSTRYNQSAKEIALLLFCRFARDSEDKKALTPTEHKWVKRKKPKQKGAVMATVVDSNTVVQARVLSKKVRDPEKTVQGKKAKDNTGEEHDLNLARNLTSLSRKELQALAKRHKIKANQKSKTIVVQLQEVRKNLQDSVQWTVSDTEESEGEAEQENLQEEPGSQPMEIDWEQGQAESESQQSYRRDEPQRELPQSTQEKSLFSDPFKEQRKLLLQKLSPELEQEYNLNLKTTDLMDNAVFNMQ